MNPKPTTPCPYDAAFIEAMVLRIKSEREVILEEIETDEEQIKDFDFQSDESAATDEVAMALTEQELGHALVETSQVTLRLMNGALKAVEDGTYGWDPENSVWIREERLNALPWADREIMEMPEDRGDRSPPSI